MDKSAGLRIRVDPQLRRDFVAVCRSQDRPAAQVLRDFMRHYIAQHIEGQQQSLFAEEEEYRGYHVKAEKIAP